MAHSIGINLCAEPLRYNVDVIVLEILCDPGNERNTNCGCEEQTDAMKELIRRVFGITRGVIVDDVTEDERIEEGEDLVDGRQNEDQDGEPAILLEVIEKNLHGYKNRSGRSTHNCGRRSLTAACSPYTVLPRSPA